MIHGLTLKEYIEEEKTKFSEMTKAEKISYFKEYYLKLCIAAVVILGIAIWMLIDFTSGIGKVVVSGGVVNLEISDEGIKYLSDGYITYLGDGAKGKNVNLAPEIFISSEDATTYTAFQAELAINNYNYLITDSEGKRFVSEKECAEEVTDITDTDFAKKYIKAGDTVYFILTGSEEEFDSGRKVLEYILNN